MIKKRRLLIVDDDVSVRAALKRLLSEVVAGADALVEKPIHFEGFLDVVNSLLTETQGERAKRREPGEDGFRYVPRWGERYFATLADKYAKPLRLACLASGSNERRNMEQQNDEHHIRN